MITGASVFSTVIAFFCATIASYSVIFRLNERFEYSSDRPDNFAMIKALYGVLSFTITFLVILILAGTI